MIVVQRRRLPPDHRLLLMHCVLLVLLAMNPVLLPLSMFLASLSSCS
jgi:hypothetical protein